MKSIFKTCFIGFIALLVCSGCVSKQAFDEKKAEAERLRSQLITLRKSLAAQENYLKKAQADLKEIKSEQEKAESQITQLKSEQEKAGSQITQSQKELSAARQEIDAKNKQLSALQKESTQLKDKLAAQAKKITEFQKKSEKPQEAAPK